MTNKQTVASSEAVKAAEEFQHSLTGEPTLGNPGDGLWWASRAFPLRLAALLDKWAAKARPKITLTAKSCSAKQMSERRSKGSDEHE